MKRSQAIIDVAAISHLINHLPADLYDVVQGDDEGDETLYPSLDAYLYLAMRLQLTIHCEDAMYHPDTQQWVVYCEVRKGSTPIIRALGTAPVDDPRNNDSQGTPLSHAQARAIRAALRIIFRPFFRAKRADGRRALLATAHVLERELNMPREARNQLLHDLGYETDTLKDLSDAELAQVVMHLAILRHNQQYPPSSQYD